jgi:hypothetical protein
MIIDNKIRVKSLKRLFYAGSLLLVIVALVFVLSGNLLVLIICCGILFFWYLFFRVADFQYIEFSDEEGKIVLRYYPVITFSSKEYNSIEFQQSVLHDAAFEPSFFGAISDLTLSVKTKKGIANYPSVSFAAVPRRQKKLIVESLQKIIGN